LRRAVVLAAALLAVGCGSIEGEDPYALWRVHEHPGQAFHFHYPAPPFEAAEASSEVHPVLEAAPEAAAAGTAWPGWRVEARVLAGADLAGAADGEATALEGRGFAVGAPAARLNRAEDEGLEIRGESGEADAVVFLLSGAAGIVAITVAGTGDMRHPDVDLLLDGFEPRGAEEH
jgi:hypothetical protein